MAIVGSSIGSELTELKSSFQNAPPDTRSGCYWYWINDNISKEGITKDLEAMARAPFWCNAVFILTGRK